MLVFSPARPRHISSSSNYFAFGAILLRVTTSVPTQYKRTHLGFDWSLSAAIGFEVSLKCSGICSVAEKQILYWLTVLRNCNASLYSVHAEQVEPEFVNKTHMCGNGRCWPQPAHARHSAFGLARSAAANKTNVQSPVLTIR